MRVESLNIIQRLPRTLVQLALEPAPSLHELSFTSGHTSLGLRVYLNFKALPNPEPS